MANSILPAARTIARQLLELSKDSDNQVMIVKEAGCIDGLVGYLDSPDEQVILLASKAIQYLSSNQENKATLCNHPQLLSKVLYIACKVDLSTGENKGIAEIARKILDYLVCHVNRQKPENVERSCEQTAPSETNPPVKCKMATVIVNAPKIQDENIRAMMEQKLILVHGVISVTLDQNQEIAVVYAREYDGLLEKLEMAVQDVEKFLEAEQNATIHRKIRPQYIDIDKFFPKGSATMAKAGGSKLLQRIEQQRNEVEQRRQRQRRVNRILGRVGHGVGRGLSAFGLW